MTDSPTYPSARIAVLIPNLLGGGAERFAVNISAELSLRGHQIDLVVGHLAGPLVEEVLQGIRVVELGSRHNSGNLLRLARYLKSERPAALLSSQPGANAISVLAGRLTGVETKIVVTQHISLVGARSHAVAGFNLRKIETAGRALVIDRFVRWALPRAHRIVAVSEGVAHGLNVRYSLPLESITVVYNPVVTKRLLAAKAEPATHPFFDQGEEPVIVGVGRFEHQKGFDDLIEALALLRRDIPAKLLLLGEGPERSALERLVVLRGLSEAVSLPGHVDHPIAYMGRASVFALSSRYEGLPTVLIEALCAGVPVVATDCESGPREILEGGRHGLLVPVGDPAALSAGLARALTGEVPPPASGSWDRFTGARVAAVYEEILLGDRTIPRPAEG